MNLDAHCNALYCWCTQLSVPKVFEAMEALAFPDVAFEPVVRSFLEADEVSLQQLHDVGMAGRYIVGIRRHLTPPIPTPAPAPPVPIPVRAAVMLWELWSLLP